MNYCLAVFSSVTYANRIKKILEKESGYMALMHTPSAISDKGCSYSLRFRKKYLQSVINASSKNNITLRGLYEETDEGYRSIDL